MISGILHLNSKTKYGMTSRNVNMYLFKPFDPKQSIFVVGCSQVDTSTNILALIQPLDMTTRIPRGNLVTVLGKCGDWEAERLAIQWTYRPHKQPKVSLLDLIEPDSDDRLDLRGCRTINVDPLGCRDVDDCITFHKDMFVITIADVGAWVAKNPRLHAFAINGQTLYDNGTAVSPMFPIELSENLFSLRVEQDRFGVSLIYPSKGLPYWRRSIVRVTHAYEYDEVKAMKEIKKVAEHASQHIVGDDPHEWIEALMVSYNSFMAEELKKRSAGLFRGHSEPDLETMDRYTKICPEAAHLAGHAAVYQTFEERTSHWGLALTEYTHMTSPIRRWADVHNQMVLLGYTSEMTEHLNNTNKAAKKYERDMFFLRQLQIPRKVSGVVLDVTNEKSKVWVADWKRVVTVRSCEFEPGTKLRLEYFLDMNQPTWKKRMVIAASRDCQEPLSLELDSP
jgi:exoribonuclease R